jgi:ATP-dependent Clp endopeptidase proteolytic subunit ClpP
LYSLRWGNDVIDFRFGLQHFIIVASPVNANNSMEQFEPIPLEIDPIGVTWSAIILLAASKEDRVGLPNSHYLIHQPLSGMRGVATEIEIHARELEKLREKINKLIADETGQSLDKVARDTDRDYWMNAEEATQYGLIAKIVKQGSDLKA